MSTASTEPVSVLIVDDTPANLRVLAEALQPEYDVLVARDGPTALDIAHKTPPPDVILLDVMMPGMDGYEVCRRLKADPRTQDIPVIFITAVDSEQAEERGFSLGAVDYITKPLSLPVVRARVRAQAHLRRRTAMLARLALIDGLTGLANRRRFDEALALEWRRARRNGEPVSLLFVDIDRFKDINDTHGHGTGDDVLRCVARAVRSVAHRPGDLAARYGGDEFIVLLPGTDLAGAQRLAGELHTAVMAAADSVIAEGFSVSVGCAELPADRGDAPEDLVRLADAAMFEVKRARRNTPAADDEPKRRATP